MQAEIWTTSWCPFCVRVKAILEDHGVSFVEHVMDDDHGALDEVKRRYEHPTVPIVVLDGQFIGGCDELAMVARAGGLAG